MSLIDTIRKDREELARVLKKHKGIRKSVEDIYPDSAHFVYELLQNADDTGAKKATFTLTRSGVVFEHNGRPFTPENVWGITDIGEGTSANDEDKIGQYGIGFKAVFGYTETPHIWSPTFSFKLTDLVLPWELAPNSDVGDDTRIEIPFNSPKKCAKDAYAEVERRLNDLATDTLLFLNHINLIAWTVVGVLDGQLHRIPHDKHHIEVCKTTDAISTSVHFLRFTEPVKDLHQCHVAIAFGLEAREGEGKGRHRKGKRLADRFRIVPANPGRVAVFFPAEKETSGLRFHLHAPFVPELSRASVKDTPANELLFQQLANLAANSLHSVRDMGLLDRDFLGVLP